jgi:uncharacterized protein YjiS (DUF1127 family)
MHTISSTGYLAQLLAQPSTSWRVSAPATLRLIALWRERTRQRQALASLDARLLHDIGVTPYDAAYECNKPFWR